MGPSTLFPDKPASRVSPVETAWSVPVELHCGECGYTVTARRELEHCPITAGKCIPVSLIVTSEPYPRKFHGAGAGAVYARFNRNRRRLL